MGHYKFSFLIHLYLILLFCLVSGNEHDNSQIFNDRTSLVSFMTGIISYPEHALESWNSSSVHVCNWSGIACNNARNAVTELDLSGRSLRGTISPVVGGLSSLTILDLSKNFLEGHIPAEVGSLVQLKQLSLSWNFLEGKIPAELGSAHQLVYVDLGNNRLWGDIPPEFFCNGTSLEYIDLSNNTLTGEIPLRNDCELKELRFLLLWSNRLVGQVPPGLAKSSKLEWLDLESNKLSGELPLHIVSKMPHLQFLYLSYNDFTSHDGNTNLMPFFDALANLSNLQELELGANKLGGDITPNIGNLSGKLVQIHLAENLIHGPIPPQISNLLDLTLLNLSSNFLNGTIPTELCRMEKLERVYLSNNSLSGEIPSALGDIPHLGLLDLSRNQLSGSIPDSFANLSQLRMLFLYQNHLSGAIPPSLGKCVNLEILDLSHNQLSGVIPNEVAGLRSLKLYINLSSNYLQGQIPFELSKMDMVLAVDLSLNNLSGTIPPQLGSCIALEGLNLSSNMLVGTLPYSIGKLPYLREFDVSSNHLMGKIPPSLQMSSTLKQINFSFNNFSGNVSDKGAFSTLTMDSFLGNEALCGSIKGMKACHQRRHRHLVILPILLSLVVTPMFCICGYPLAFKSRIRRQFSIFGGGDLADEEDTRREQKYPKISHRQLMEATGRFSPSSLIGSGRFGHVYKGVLPDNKRIAVKVLDTRAAGEISGIFKRECRVLKRTRHRNLIRIITTCSRPDFQALVLPLMSNGSLERHLYPSHGMNHGLTLVQLVNICSDVAEGLTYLHHHSPIRIVHCDLKPSNILLDDDMTALVTDFGIARLVKGVDENVSSYDTASFSSTDGLLYGSIGYIAPEYGMGKRASTQGDVYSFGVLLLEIVTGIRPTDVLCNEGSNLHELAKSHYLHNLDPLVEQALSRCNPPTLPNHFKQACQDVIVELIELGLVCTQFSPSTRPTMLDVAYEMSRLKQYLSMSSSHVKEATSSTFDPSR